VHKGIAQPAGRSWVSIIPDFRESVKSPNIEQIVTKQYANSHITFVTCVVGYRASCPLILLSIPILLKIPKFTTSCFIHSPDARRGSEGPPERRSGCASGPDPGA